jgi:hypothetical protein
MGFGTWADSKIKVKKLGILDIQLIKLSALCFGLTIGACLSVWILPYWWIFILLAIMAAIKPIYKAIRK